MDGACITHGNKGKCETKLWSSALETLRTWRTCGADIQNDVKGMGLESLDWINLA